MGINPTFDAPDVIELRDALRSFARRGIGHAARNTLNGVAFEARREWVGLVRTTMTLRNKFTERSLRVTKARGTNMRRMTAITGSVAPFMLTQEQGGSERKSGRHGVAIPTSVSSGEGRDRRPRRRQVRRGNRLANIRLRTRGGARGPMNRKRRNIIAIRMAQRTGRKLVFLDLGRRAGIFKIAGRKTRPRLDMLWDTSRATVRIPATSTLERTLRRVVPRLDHIQERALLEQLRRHGVLPR